MSTKHTPWPWHFEPKAGRITADGLVIEIYGKRKTADGRLIVQSPRLLEVAQQLLGKLRRTPDFLSPEAMYAREVIAAVEGR